MHRQIAGRSLLRQRILEIGAGTLNHLRYEPEAATYDVVEPFSALYENSQELDRTNAIFRDIADIPSTNRYDRIVSVAVLEHVEDLPTLLAFNGLLLGSEGLSQHAIPSEGAFLWGLGWRCTTAISYRARTGLDYARLMRWEHINNASEIECLVRHFFRDVSIVRFPIAVFHLSFYTCIEARHPLRERCLAHLQSKGFNVGDYVRTT